MSSNTRNIASGENAKDADLPQVNMPLEEAIDYVRVQATEAAVSAARERFNFLLAAGGVAIAMTAGAVGTLTDFYVGTAVEEALKPKLEEFNKEVGQSVSKGLSSAQTQLEAKLEVFSGDTRQSISELRNDMLFPALLVAELARLSGAQNYSLETGNELVSSVGRFKSVAQSLGSRERELALRMYETITDEFLLAKDYYRVGKMYDVLGPDTLEFDGLLYSFSLARAIDKVLNSGRELAAPVMETDILNFTADPNLNGYEPQQVLRVFSQASEKDWDLKYMAQQFSIEFGRHEAFEAALSQVLAIFDELKENEPSRISAPAAEVIDKIMVAYDLAFDAPISSQLDDIDPTDPDQN